MLRQRAISAIAFLPPLIVSIWFGGIWFSLIVGVAALLGFVEFHRLVSKKGQKSLLFPGMVLMVAITYCACRGITFYTAWLLPSLILFTLVWIVFHSLICESERAFSDWIWTLGGIIYIGWLLGFWILLRETFGEEWTLLAILSTFAVDTAAYFTGRAWGRHPLSPRISPSKSWEGGMGGVIGGIVVAILLGYLLRLVDSGLVGVVGAPQVGMWKVVVLGLVLGTFAQVGDLTESTLKREVGVGEASKLIPGHGGMLDRLDSLLFTGVLTYYYLMLV